MSYKVRENNKVKSTMDEDVMKWAHNARENINCGPQKDSFDVIPEKEFIC